ncbi:uncharacterized protein LOC109540991 [Dendroctonus ponderosae]|uniref:RUN domain-containing protein n=1 Tax=Dendroctonus ponderosae TaxID=77166 RepID=U4U1J0_DENPD|nr:uncharacterized protein LOC109540991 [Dendroctonus ponderosae]XP_019765168.2 uncharacterized protein LOC109540991 [Dendroctonus ponderosae]XP_019765169.2 uncharacterized protein LOC109540991 [Dendroctonus ponderosae]XP_019765170.2 uncharacterized protein LOC109540991 [Dendroctonus ponderosae]XP_019765171.2 uncharacterized protein LOC109540991 [Dendroctonus ponderosae]XP_019765172.2 uncharacterized protein LOC109540991 [Dendroctonus ponderosae]XP_019765173.2 uncharacterized protein LOC10954
MNKFLKSGRSPSRGKDDILKKSITSNLSNTIKEIQYACIEEGKGNKVIDVTDVANEFCTIVEAVFLHGLRDSMTHRFRKAMARLDERPPPPDFWAPLLIISHKQIIDQITHLSQITSEVGYCRAWIRIALNDCLLSSYLLTIRQDASAMKSYYNPTAFIRDNDMLDVAQRLIEGVEGIKTFTMPINSSLLNTWPSQSLVWAGIWFPTLKNTPLAPCDDVAMIIEEDSKLQGQEEVSDTASLCSAMSFGSQTSSLRQVVALSEDEVLKIILAKDDNAENAAELPHSTSHANSELKQNTKCVDSSKNRHMGNSLDREGWSFDETQHEDADRGSKGETEQPANTEMSKSMEGSFTALVENYNMVGGSYIRTPDIKGMWQKFEDERMKESSPSPPECTSSVSASSSPVRSETTSLASQVFKIAGERGLDVQNFECAGCKSCLDEQNYKVCHYTGEYFCNACMSVEEVTIPARMIHNWDFKVYPVSQKSFNYLNEVKDYPVIDFKSLNPYIYGAVEEMAELQVLRNQLNFLRAYLYTCREPIIEQLQKQMWPREYMYEHIHQYSITDLHDIQSGTLASQLQKVVKFGRDHVFSCWLCSQKGFVCEVCNNPKSLFPFDVENVFRCDLCNAVYHKNCLNSSKPCRKCERRKKREDLPLDGAICPE